MCGIAGFINNSKDKKGIIQKMSKADISVEGIQTMFKTDALVYEVNLLVLKDLAEIVVNSRKKAACNDVALGCTIAHGLPVVAVGQVGGVTASDLETRIGTKVGDRCNAEVVAEGHVSLPAQVDLGFHCLVVRNFPYLVGGTHRAGNIGVARVVEVREVSTQIQFPAVAENQASFDSEGQGLVRPTGGQGLGFV